MLVAGRSLDQVAASRERKVVAGDQHTVGRGAVEDLLARGHRLRPVDIESGLLIGVAREHGGVLGGVA